MVPTARTIGQAARARAAARPGMLLPTLLYLPASLAAFVAADRFLTVDGVSVWFPPAAVTLAYLVAVGGRGAPVVLATRLGLAATMDPSFRLNNVVLTSSLVVGAYACGAVVLRRHLGRHRSRLHEVAAFGAAGIAVALAGAVLAVGYLVAATPRPLSRFPQAAMSFWLGDVAAVLALAPLAVGLARADRPRPGARRTTPAWLAAAELALQMGLLAAAAWYAVAPDVDSPQFYPTFIPLIWIALRRGLRGASAAIAATGLLVPLLAVTHGGTAGQMTDLQLFMVVYALTGLVMGAVESDRRAARTRVDESELQLREVIASSTEAFVSFGPHGVVREWNRAAEQLLGWARAEVVDRPLADTVLPAEVRELHRATLAEALGAAGRPSAGRRVELPALRRDGTPVPLEVVLWPVASGGEVWINAFFHDISQRKELEDGLRALAERDPLTGLANRSAFLERLAASGRDGPGTTAVLFVDLDDFKPVNDHYGHAVGDQVLRVVAERLVGALREGDTAGRIGGDEFVVLCDGIDPAAAARLAARLEEVLAEPVTVDGRSLAVGASVGWRMAASSDDPEAVIQAADRAMYERKVVRKAESALPSR